MTYSLTLSDPALDADHAQLQALIVRLLHVPAEEAVAVFNELLSRASAHFAAEDLELQAISDEAAMCHINEHAAVLKSFSEVADLLVQPSLAEEARVELLRRLAGRLFTWLPEHVQMMDASVATHRSRKRFGGEPVFIGRRSAG